MADAFYSDNIYFSYSGVPVLSGITLHVPVGGMHIICGRSGCGKSTLLEVFSSQRTPLRGKIFWHGDDVTTYSHNDMIRARQRMGFVFQKHALIHNFTTFDNIALPLRYHTDTPERVVCAKVKQCMEKLGLFNVDKKYPNELSVVQAKSAAIARAIVMSPSLLFLDEPTAGLDPVAAQGIANVISEINADQHLAVVVVGNSIEMMNRLQCSVSVLDKGKLQLCENLPSTQESFLQLFLTSGKNYE